MMQKSAPAEAGAPGWRYKAGLSLFILAVVSPAFAPLVAFTELSTEWKAIIAGFLVVGGPEVFTVAAIALLGKSGFNHLKVTLFGWLKRYAPTREVRRSRYYIGLTMLLAPLVLGWLTGYVPQLLAFLTEHPLSVSLITDFVFFASFFVLGGDFWDKIRALFVYEAKAQYPERAR